MSEVIENFSLLGSNTFQIDVNASFFVELDDITAVKDFLLSDLIGPYPLLILGGGSNVLFTKDFKGIIIHPTMKGIVKTGEDSDTVLIRAGAGEEWDGFVEHCVDHEWGGIENLSLIPGTVGASPVQNIGAYGVEIMDLIDSVEGIMINNGKIFRLTARECQFSYRDSIFKKELKDKVLITHVNFRLNKKHQFKTSYPDLEKELDNFPDKTINTIRQAIIAIRRTKLPDPAVTGNAGSFFKNPFVNKEQAASLRRFYPGMPVHDCAGGLAKLSAAWLIEQCGWKGKNFGKAGTHKRQPLIIINRGGASGGEILECALKIQKSVMNHFAIKLEMEVNVL
jgi:UDP-N-acetylmuramate dehydrogenase